MDNKYIGYSPEERNQALNSLLRNIIGLFIPGEAIYGIVDSLMIRFNAHPNIFAFTNFNPYFNEIAKYRDIYDALRTDYNSNILLGCGCSEKNHECGCADNADSRYQLLEDAKLKYDKIREANYNSMITWMNDYYAMWFFDTYGEKVKDEFNDKALEEMKKKYNEIVSEVSKILDAAKINGTKEEVELYENKFEEANDEFDSMTNDFFKNYDALLRDAIKEAMKKFSVDDWIADGNLEDLMGASHIC